VHVAVSARGEKFVETVFGIAERIGTHDAGDVETVGARDVAQRGVEPGGIVQKSRSA